MVCPNKSHPVYKEIAAKYDEARADEAYVKNGYEIPESLAAAEELLKKPLNQTGATAQSTSARIRKTILDALKVQAAIYGKAKGSEAKLERVETLISKLEKDFTINAILELLEAANNFTTEALIRLSAIENTIKKGINTLSPEELSYLASQTNEIKDLLSTYSILQDAEKLFVDEDPNLALINNVMRKRRTAIDSFKMIHEELVAQWLTNAAERVNKALEASDKAQWRVSKDMIKRLLNTATSDISFWEECFGAQANSKDPITGLVAAAIKEEAFLGQKDDDQVLMELMPLYEQMGGDKNNPAKFNKDYIREVKVREWVYELDSKGNQVFDANGNPKRKLEYVKKKAFQQEYLTDDFERAKLEELKKVAAGIDEDSAKNRAKVMQTWYEENTELVDTDELMARKKQALTIQDYNAWFARNTKEIRLETYSNGETNARYYSKERIHEIKGDKIIIYTGEFIKPNKKWANPAWAKLSKDKYYMALYKTYRDANDKLPTAKQLQHGMLPQVEMTEGEILTQHGATAAAKHKAKAAINVRAYDKTMGLQTPSGASVKFVPVLFTDQIDNEYVSNDLLRSTLMFSQSSNRYSRMNKVQPIVALLTDIVEGNSSLGIEPRKVQELNSKGETMINAITKTLRLKTPSTTRVNRTLSEFLDKVIYDEREIQVAVGNISINKIAAKLGGYSAITKLGLNLSAGINNEIFGNYSNFVEGVAGQYFDLKHFASAQAEYMSSVGGFMMDLSAGYPKSKIGVLAMMYDAIQGEFEDEYGRKLSGTALKRAFSTNAMFFLQKSGEHHIQTSGMIAMMKATKVQGPNGEISLWDAYDEKGKLKPGIKWTQKDQFAFMQRLHKMNKDLHGIYNKFDSPTIQRRWYGKLAMMFRKYMYTGFNRRFTSRYLDIEGADVYEGYFRTFFRALTTDLKTMKFNMLLAKNMDETSRKNMYRAYTDLLFLAGAMTLFSLLGAAAGDDDEENSWAVNQILLQSRRFSGDLMWYVNPSEFIKLTKSPAVSLDTVDSLIDFFVQLTTNPFEQYERKTAGFDKGDYKIEHELYKNFPGLSGIYRSLVPEQQLKIYRSYNK